MQHVRVGEHDVGTLPDGTPGVLRGIAIVSEGAQIRTHFLNHAVQFFQLIFGKSLGGEQVHGPRAGFGREAVKHRQVVAKRLTAGGGCNDHHIRPRSDPFISLRLMRIGAGDAPVLQHRPEFGVDSFREFGVVRSARRRAANGTHGAVFLQCQPFQLLHYGCDVTLYGRQVYGRQVSGRQVQFRKHQ